MRRSLPADLPVGAPLELEIWVGDGVPERRPAVAPPPEHRSAARGGRGLVASLGLVVGAALGVPVGAAAITAAEQAEPVAEVPDAGEVLLLERLDGVAASHVHRGSGPWVLRPEDDGGVAVIELGRDEWVLVRRDVPRSAVSGLEAAP